MDNRQLEVFLAVAHQGSFTRAAASLHMVQSAASATVAALESDLREKLFDRTTRQVRLTAAGRALVPHATEIINAFQAARDAVEAVGGGLSGSIRVGYMTNVALFDIPQLLGRFTRDYPDVTIRLAPAITGTAGLVEQLRSGDIDLGFIAAEPSNYPDLDIIVLASSSLVLGVATDHPLANRTSMKLAEMTGLRFVDFRKGFSNRTLVDAEFQRRGLRREVQIESSDTSDTAALVRNGLGAGFLPRYLVENDPEVKCIEIEDAVFQMHVSVATARGRTLAAAATRLADLARGQAGQSQQAEQEGQAG